MDNITENAIERFVEGVLESVETHGESLGHEIETEPESGKGSTSGVQVSGLEEQLSSIIPHESSETTPSASTSIAPYESRETTPSASTSIAPYESSAPSIATLASISISAYESMETTPSAVTCTLETTPSVSTSIPPKPLKSKKYQKSKLERLRTRPGHFFVHKNDGKFRVRPMGPDGNCLFRSLAYHVMGSQSHHQRMRSTIVLNIHEHWEHYKNFSIIEDRQSYKDSMGKLEEYGTEMEIVAFADVYDCRVKVYLLKDPEQEPMCFGGNGPTCLLLYSGKADEGHYDVLRPCAKGDIEPYWQGINKIRSDEQTLEAELQEVQRDPFRL